MEPHWKCGGYYRVPKDSRAPKLDNICIEYICPLCEIHGFDGVNDHHLVWQMVKRSGKVYRRYPWLMRHTQISDATELGPDLEPTKLIQDTRQLPSDKKRISPAVIERELLKLAETVPYPLREDPDDPSRTLTVDWYAANFDRYRRSLVDPLNKLVVQGKMIRRQSAYPRKPFIYERPR